MAKEVGVGGWGSQHWVSDPSCVQVAREAAKLARRKVSQHCSTPPPCRDGKTPATITTPALCLGLLWPPDCCHHQDIKQLCASLNIGVLPCCLTGQAWGVCGDCASCSHPCAWLPSQAPGRTRHSSLSVVLVYKTGMKWGDLRQWPSCTTVTGYVSTVSMWIGAILPVRLELWALTTVTLLPCCCLLPGPRPDNFICSVQQCFLYHLGQE